MSEGSSAWDDGCCSVSATHDEVALQYFVHVVSMNAARTANTAKVDIAVLVTRPSKHIFHEDLRLTSHFSFFQYQLLGDRSPAI
jgi:hypothetical protein